MLYAIQAVAQTINTFPDASLCGELLEGASHRCTRQLPTFYLDSDVQGIVDVEHAESIAERLLTSEYESSVDVTVNASPVSSVLVPSDVASEALTLLRLEEGRQWDLARADRPMVESGADSGARMRDHEREASRLAEMTDVLDRVLAYDRADRGSAGEAVER